MAKEEKELSVQERADLLHTANAQSTWLCNILTKQLFEGSWCRSYCFISLSAPHTVAGSEAFPTREGSPRDVRTHAEPH